MIQKKPILTISEARSEVNKYDIGLYYDRTDTLTDREVYDLIDNVWKPPQDFSFPSSNEFGKSRKFSVAWFDIYPWLTYSKYYDGCFCLACVLFGRKTGQSDDKLTNLYKEPLTSWTHASERLKTHHSNSKLHKDAKVIMEFFKQRMRNEFVPVDVLAYSVRQERIEKNWQKLKSILKTVIFFGQHDIALRGHRDDSNYYDSTSNVGKFPRSTKFQSRVWRRYSGRTLPNMPKECYVSVKDSSKRAHRNLWRLLERTNHSWSQSGQVFLNIGRWGRRREQQRTNAASLAFCRYKGTHWGRIHQIHLFGKWYHGGKHCGSH